MTRLQQEQSRLYLRPGSAGSVLPDDGGFVRVLVMELSKPADWKGLSAVWHGVQNEFDLPAPAIAVSGTDGIQLWFSLAEAISTTFAHTFLSGLVQRYLDTISPKRLRTFPAQDGQQSPDVRHMELVPAIHPDTGNWSAFIQPDLAAIFGEEPWLDLPPNPEQQADILCKLQSISPDQLTGALAILNPNNSDSAIAVGAGTCLSAPTLPVLKPKEFLLWVMNDPKTPLKERIEAAKALLPYSS